MTNTALIRAVEQFARQTQNIPDAQLDLPWKWRSYSEGIRFAFFRTYEELRELAVILRSERAPLTQAQRILATYEAAYWDLQSVLSGVADGLEEQIPGEGAWSIRKVFSHILDAEVGFHAIIRYHVEGYRSSDGALEEISEETFHALRREDDAALQGLNSSPWKDLLDFYRDVHAGMIRDCADITEAELEMPSFFWEDEPMSLRFRLHRLDSHIRQHTIQIQKALDVIGPPPNEARRLLRLIYAALADVNAGLIGAPRTGELRQQVLADTLTTRAAEIRQISAAS